MKVLVLERGAALDAKSAAAMREAGYDLSVMKDDLDLFRALGREDWDAIALCGDVSSITRARIKLACEDAHIGGAVIDVPSGERLLAALERRSQRRAA